MVPDVVLDVASTDSAASDNGAALFDTLQERIRPSRWTIL
jgi:hypothetical protein